MLPNAADRQVAATTAWSGMPVSLEDGGVHEDDVRHRDEGSGAGENFRLPIGAERSEFEVTLQPIARGQAPARLRRASMNDFTHMPT